MVRNDRYGFHPLYYFTRPGEVCISTSILGLLAQGAPPEFDEPGLAVFLRLGFFLGEDTPFKAIRAVPPDARFEWRDGHLSLQGRYAFGRQQSLTWDAAIDAYISLFREAIKRRLPPGEDFAVPVSGGKDSRHILLELCEAGYPPKFCVTIPRFPPSLGEDVEVATALAKALRMRYVVLKQTDSQLQAELEKNLQTSFCADEHAWYLALVEYLKGRTSLVYDGIGGDVLSESLNLNAERVTLFDSGRFANLAQRLFVRSDAGLARLLRPFAYQRMGRDLAIERVVAELEKHAGAPNAVGSFYFWNRTRREVALAPYGMITRAAQVYSPYLDHDLYDFLASLPATMLLNRRLHTDTIRRAYPRYADIPYDRRLISTGMRRAQTRRLAWELARYALTHVPSRLVRGPYLVPRLAFGLATGKMTGAVDPLVPYLLQLGSVVHTG